MNRFALLAIVFGVASIESVAQAPAPDPWKRVPALPTSCLADEFPTAVSTLHETIKSELTTQKEVNDAIKLKFGEMDIGVKMQKMQAYMAKNPQDAEKVVKAMQGAAATQTDDFTGADADKTALGEQLKELTAEFKAASEAAAKPFRTRQSQMIDSKAEWYAGGHRFKTKADQDALMDLLKQEDAAYEKACAPYFGTGGKFHTWLNEYRTKVAERVATGTDANESTIEIQFVMFDFPAKGYRKTGQLVGVRDYLAKIGDVYELRVGNARPPQDLILIK